MESKELTSSLSRSNMLSALRIDPSVDDGVLPALNSFGLIAG